MKEIELSEKSNNTYVDFEPVEIGENISISSSRSIRNGSYVIEGNVNNGENSIGRFVMDDRDGRLFVNVKLDGLEQSTKSEIVETISAIIVKLIPSNVEDEQ